MTDLDRYMHSFLAHKTTNEFLVNSIWESDILKHYSQKTGSVEMRWLLREMIYGVLLKYKKWDNISEKDIIQWISNIEKDRNNLFDYMINNLLDSRLSDLLKHQKYFYIHQYITPENTDMELAEILKKSQYLWYKIFLDMSLFLFIQFLKENFLGKKWWYIKDKFIK